MPPRKSKASKQQQQKRRAVVYVFAGPSLRKTPVERLRDELAAQATALGMEVVEVVLDCEPPKQQPSDYPVLDLFARGEADILYAVRSDRRTYGATEDWLEARCLPAPVAILDVAALHERGILAASARKRLLVYWFAPESMRNAPVEGMRERMERFASEGGMELVDIIIDSGPPKKHPRDYPVLARLERGEADLLLLGRSELLKRSAEQDLLESTCRPEPMAFFTAAELQALGLLPVDRSEGEARVAPPEPPHPQH